MTITSLHQTSPGRITVGFEDGSEIKTTLGVITDLRLFTGRDLDCEATERLRLSSEHSIARERAIELLSRRQMSCKELRDKLVTKGESAETADFCVSWLSENGLIDDESYAAAVVRHYAAKGYGIGRINAELSRRGISRELRDSAAENAPDSSDKLDKLVASKLKNPADKEQIRKLCASLYRRGFQWNEIRSALERYNAQLEDLE